ncbi:hypothetical protein BGX27_008738 [Mortierella sp. AM989]|nr:hypothetical protein BGX27_008738 [Mortierella sp. AM989]
MSSNGKRPLVVDDSGDESLYDEDFEITKEGLEETAASPQAVPKGKMNKKTKAEKLGPKKRLTVRSWRNQTLVDIREFYNDKDGESKPGKKGISLTKDQFQYILDHITEINKAINEVES